MKYLTKNHRFIKAVFVNRAKKLFILLFVISSISSCIPKKNLKYFNNLGDAQVIQLPLLTKPQTVIMPDDMLEIKIAGANEGTAALLNTYSATATIAATVPVGYLVDMNGNIEFPILGKVKAAGLTKDQFKESLKEKVSKYLVDPLVSVRYLNFRFTVIGEVKAPGSFIVQNERVTILDALGLSGDMTSYSNRTNVRIIRDSSGVREVGTLDFNDKKIFTSKYYYLQRNDVIYIEAQKSKSQYEEWSRMGSIVATLTSLIALTITIIRR